MGRKPEVPDVDVTVEWSSMKQDTLFVGALVPFTLLAIVMIAGDGTLFIGFALLVLCAVASVAWLVHKMLRILKNPPRIRTNHNKYRKSRDMLLVNWEDSFREIEKYFREPPAPPSN